MGMAEIRISEPERRDRLLLMSPFAMVLLTTLRAAGESLGMERLLKSNTLKTRTHSLFRRGCMLYELIPNMPEHRLLPLMQRFAETENMLRLVHGNRRPTSRAAREHSYEQSYECWRFPRRIDHLGGAAPSMAA
jgi:hypothetical protein